jgi:hypothetical protein
MLTTLGRTFLAVSRKLEGRRALSARRPELRVKRAKLRARAWRNMKSLLK